MPVNATPELYSGNLVSPNGTLVSVFGLPLCQPPNNRRISSISCDPKRLILLVSEFSLINLLIKMPKTTTCNKCGVRVDARGIRNHKRACPASSLEDTIDDTSTEVSASPVE